MAHVSCEPTLRSVVRSSMPRKLGGNRRAVVYYNRAAHAFSTGIKYRHCCALFADNGVINSETT